MVTQILQSLVLVACVLGYWRYAVLVMQRRNPFAAAALLVEEIKDLMLIPVRALRKGG